MLEVSPRTTCEEYITPVTFSSVILPINILAQKNIYSFMLNFLLIFSKKIIYLNFYVFRCLLDLSADVEIRLRSSVCLTDGTNNEHNSIMLQYSG